MRAVSVLFAMLALPLLAAADDKPRVDFARDVRPIMQTHCFECHDGRKQKAGLRLDVRADALRGGESGKPTIVPGNSAKSELLRRVTSTGETEVMPPKGARLTAAQVNVLRDWLDSGANWPDALAGGDDRTSHWAFRAPVRPEVPKGEHAIDYFVRERLKKEGLKPSPEADRITLIRRLSLDLIGLPPTPEEVDRFLKESSAKPQAAYEALVERLLASPHYGEKWGRHWLDAARYADSDGFEKDKSRQVWAYREWVINALNRDLPYDRFIIEQLAGDLLPNPTQDQIVATGYLRNSMINEEGGVDPEQFRMEAMFDRMDAIGKGILGLTVQCAQCHNHKFDPLTQNEYYRLFAFLNNAHEASVAAYTPAEQMQRADIFRQIKAIEDELRHRTPDWQKRMREWEAKVRDNQPKWEIVRPQLDASGGQKHYLLEDGSILAAGYAPTKHTTDFTGKVELTKITAARLELLNDPNLPLSGPGRSIYGLFALSEFRVEINGKPVKIVSATADANPNEKPLGNAFDDRSKAKRVTGPIGYAIDDKNETAWSIDVGPGRSNVPRKAVFVFERPIEAPKGATVTFKLVQMHGGWNSDDNQNNNLGRFRLSVTDAEAVEADPLPARVREAMKRMSRTSADEEAIFSHWRTTVPEWKEANEKIEKLWQQHPEGSSQLTMAERDKPRETRMLKRGDFLKPGDPVSPGVPEFLHPLPKDAQGDRLTFAKWLVDPKSPTTARSLVNRVWQNYFGTGLVSTSEDLGTQAETPSHPELLDWLAMEFVRPDNANNPAWSLKHLHRLIVHSASYRQSSKVSPELVAKDPDNRLLARGPRFRVEAETVRDIALSASGLLNAKIGGRSVFPPLPAFMLLPPVSYGPKIWPEDKGPERYRRALYTFRYRSIPYPVLQTFDAPNGDFACVRRPRSNTPLQALMTLNEPVFVECAEALAEKTLKEGGKSDTERLAYAFRRCVSRTPTETESAELLKLLAKQSKRGDEKAAWTVVARVLLNLDETITKD